MPLLRHLERHDLRESHEAVLGRDVGALEGRGDQPVDRGHVDHPPPAALLHARQRGARGVEGRRQVDREDRVPLLDRQFVHGSDVLDAGVVHEDVDGAERSPRPCARGRRSRRAWSCRRRGRGPSRRTRFSMPARSASIASFSPRPFSITLRALRGEGAGHAQADAARRSGDQHRLSRECLAHVQFLPRCRFIRRASPTPAARRVARSRPRASARDPGAKRGPCAAHGTSPRRDSGRRP